jgi:hypothetical protein
MKSFLTVVVIASAALAIESNRTAPMAVMIIVWAAIVLCLAGVAALWRWARR